MVLFCVSDSFKDGGVDRSEGKGALYISEIAAEKKDSFSIPPVMKIHTLVIIPIRPPTCEKADTIVNMDLYIYVCFSF